jgi:hypothetical protein
MKQVAPPLSQSAASAAPPRATPVGTGSPGPRPPASRGRPTRRGRRMFLGLSATSLQYFLSQQISHQQPASSTFLSEQTITSHQPPAKRTCCLVGGGVPPGHAESCAVLTAKRYRPRILDSTRAQAAAQRHQTSTQRERRRLSFSEERVVLSPAAGK